VRRAAGISPPGYEKERPIFLGRKVETACLNCHSTGLRPDAASLFQARAVECERCHGPGDPAVAAQLAYTYDLGGEHEKAEALYRQALKADPDNLIALTNMGTHLAQLTNR